MLPHLRGSLIALLTISLAACNGLPQRVEDPVKTESAKTAALVPPTSVNPLAPASPIAKPQQAVVKAAAPSSNALAVSAPDKVVTLQAPEPRFAAPESLRRFRFAQTSQPVELNASPSDNRPQELSASTVATVTAGEDSPRYKLPDSLNEWHSGRKVPLYADPDAAPWQATPTEARLRNAAVSCNYKDEGGVRGKVMLLIDDFKLTRFNARIEMPNGGICQFDSKKMEQKPFEQGIALQSKGDECVVRMWEQKSRITIAAYSCHKQCSRGSFSYLWPILMDTRIGTCY